MTTGNQHAPGAGEHRAALAARLRDLRTREWPDLRVTQGQLAEALGTSLPTISSWESRANTALPSEDRLQSYARFFATRRSVNDGHGRLLADSDLTEDEERRRRELIDDLVRLQRAARAPTSHARAEHSGRRFWHFPDGQQVRIITSPLSTAALTSDWRRAQHPHGQDPGLRHIDYASGWHPNYVASLWDGDRDATVELFGHIRAENPQTDVRFLTADRATSDDLTGHVVILGQGDTFLGQSGGSASALGTMVKRSEFPFKFRVPDGGDPEFDCEVVVTSDKAGVPTYYPGVQAAARTEVYRPTFVRDESTPERPRVRRDGFPLLEYDVALIARTRNEYKTSATVTLCSGVFSRGTYGAVRALTDANLRGSNENYLDEAFDREDFWFLFQVPVFQGGERAETITPDLTRPFHRLRSSAGT